MRGKYLIKKFWDNLDEEGIVRLEVDKYGLKHHLRKKFQYVTNKYCSIDGSVYFEVFSLLATVGNRLHG